MNGRVAGDDEKVPVEGVRAVITLVGGPAQDLPVDVFLPRVGPAHRLAVFAAFDVVGQGAIDLAVLGADHNPLRAVHACGPDGAGCHASMNQHFGLIGKTLGRIDAVFAVAQFNPLAVAFRAIGVAVATVKTRHIKRAVVEQVAVGLGVLVVDPVAADEFIDELAALIVAHVDHGAAVAGFGKCGIFVFEAAQGGAFDGRGKRVERVDFHHPAVAVELVGVECQVETRVVLVPVDVFAGSHGTVAFLRSVEGLLGVRAAKAVREVFLARQVGAPWRFAVGAVLECAQCVGASGVSLGAQQFVASSRATEANGGVAVNAAVERRALDKLPAIALALNLNHRHAFRGLGLAHFFGAGRRATVGVEVAIVGVFVVDCHQGPVGVIGEGEQAHAVVVVAKLHFLLAGRAVAGRVERRACSLQRLAPTDENRSAVARWQADGVGGGCVDAVKAQQVTVGSADTRRQCAAPEQAAAEEHRRAAQGASADKATSTKANHLLKVGGLVFF